MMNKDTFIRKMAETTGRTLAETKTIVNDTLEMLQKAVIEDGGVDFHGFMKIEKVHQPERERRNLQTGEMFMAKAKDIPKVKFSSKFKNAVNGEV